LNDASIMMCTRIKMLYVSGNHNITTCAPFAKTLKYLEANDGCGIGDDGIKMCTKLKSLSVDNNCNITTCAPFANTLVKLSACGIHSKIGDAGLVRCTKIVELRANQNHNITTCAPFAATLVTLYTPYERGISYNSIKMCTKLRNICRYPFD